MAAPGPHSCWQRYALALIAAAGLTLAAVPSPADSPKPTATPLWDAYPLNDGSTTAEPPATAPPPDAAPLPAPAPRPELRADSGSASTPLQIVFFGCLGVVLLAIARAVVVRVVRRRRASRSDVQRMGAT